MGGGGCTSRGLLNWIFRLVGLHQAHCFPKLEVTQPIPISFLPQWLKVLRLIAAAIIDAQCQYVHIARSDDNTTKINLGDFMGRRSASKPSGPQFEVSPKKLDFMGPRRASKSSSGRLIGFTMNPFSIRAASFSTEIGAHRPIGAFVTRTIACLRDRPTVGCGGVDFGSISRCTGRRPAWRPRAG